MQNIDEELLLGFLDESFSVLTSLKQLLAKFKDKKDAHVFETFGQQIDRIMGAAYTLSLTTIGDLAKLGKELGYKGSQITDISKLLSIQSLLGQLVRTLETFLKCLGRSEAPDISDAKVLLKKLQKASKDLGNLRVTVGG